MENELNNKISKTRKIGISASTLSIIAMFTMLLDHTRHILLPNELWLSYIGRLAFPIFCFTLVEGYYNTKNFNKYALRLFIFGLISEIPFNFMLAEHWSYLGGQNVMFELLLGLFAIRQIDKLKQGWNLEELLFIVIKLFLIIVSAELLQLDYGYRGILVIIGFAIFRGTKISNLGYLLTLLVIFVLTYEGLNVEILGKEIMFPVQGLCILSTPFMWLYNNKKGINNRVFKYIKYWFYPLHLTILNIVYFIM